MAFIDQVSKIYHKNKVNQTKTNPHFPTSLQMIMKVDLDQRWEEASGGASRRNIIIIIMALICSKNLLTAPQTISNTYVQVAAMCNCMQQIRCLPRAMCAKFISALFHWLKPFTHVG